ncbi:hypothetical protein VP01_1193g6 [Puccinia sorghi]|uniref:SNF2 N-terminal domain-containing protein n=1 Tax=Puccinia sorghi TaxID=27349 RepID=A0A0L6VQQ3_9BASI|nr:hypothetical protein VP01_1193g6 [Puccinia sorghi]
MDPSYRAEEFWEIPHSLHVNVGKHLVPEKPIHGCKKTLLVHQQEALEFILELELPESSTLSRFWNSSTSEWLKHLFDHLLNTRITKGPFNHHNQGSILADDIGLGKTLTSLALIVVSKDAADVFAEIHKHLDLNLSKYAVYHGEERQNWLTQMLWANNIVLVTYDTVASLYKSRCDTLYKEKWFHTILDEAHLIRDSATKQSRVILALETQMECQWRPVENKGD